MKEIFKEVNKWFLVGCCIVILAVVVMVIFVLIKDNGPKQLVCESNNGNITLFYNNNTIEGYTSNGYTYDLLSEQSRAEQVGIDKYIEEYASIFNTNTSGTCTFE